MSSTVRDVTEPSDITVAAYTHWHEGRVGDGVDVLPGTPWQVDALRHLGDVDGKDVLEIGCGLGEFAQELARRGARVVACDLIPFAVDETERRLAGFPTAQAKVADIQRLSFRDASFDLVVSLETLEHVDDPGRALRELVRVTRPGGRLIITGPNYLSLMGLSRILLRLVGRRFTELGQPINKVTLLARHLRQLRRAGCVVEQAYAHDHLFIVPGRPTMQLRFLDRLPLDRFAYQFCIVARRETASRGQS
jgi:SAM-dependent methyltransferase